MTLTLLTPIDLSDARKVGRRKYRKQILPLGAINYKGKRIVFDRQFHLDLSRAFKANAYDQVPFVLANEKNEHHMDPKLFEGNVTDLVVAEDGLDAVVELTPEGEALIEKNPRLGVSARIVQGLAKSDGRTFKRAIQHVLATMDPRVTGLRPWQAIDLSEFDNSEVVDLTAETYEGKVTQMPKSKVTLGKVDRKAKTATIDLSAFSDDEFTKMIVDLTGGEEVEIDPKTGKPVVVDPNEEVDPDAVDPEVDPEAEDGEDEVDPVQPTTEQHSAVTQRPLKRKTTVEESTVVNDPLEPVVANLSNEFASFKRGAAKADWDHRRKSLEDQGVPPFILDLAEPVLSIPTEMVIDLSEAGGTRLDPKDIISKMLDGYVGAIDLSPEMGHAIELSDLQAKEDPDQAFLDAWAEQYGN